MDDRDALQQQIDYYTSLIQSHSSYSSSSPRDGAQSHHYRRPYQKQHSWTKPAAAQDSRYTLVRNHAANPNHQRRIVTPAQRTVQEPQSAQPSSSRMIISKSNRTVISRANPDTSSQSRRVVVPGSSKSEHRGGAKRTVLKPSTDAMKALLVNRTTSQPKSTSDVKLPLTKPLQHSQKISSRTVVKNSTLSASSQDSVNSQPPPPQKSKFVWVNKNILSKQAIERPASTSKNSQRSQPTATSSQYVHKSDYKVVKSQPIGNSPGKLQISSSGKKIVSRYKLIKKDVANRRAAAARFKTSTQKKSGYSPYVSKSGKRLVSRYKITRQSAVKHKMSGRRNNDIGASPSLKLRSSKTRLSPYKLDRREKVTLRSRYKIDKLSKSRKPIQKITTPKSSKGDRRSYRWVKSGLKLKPTAFKSPSFMSPYKLVRTAIVNNSTISDSAARKRDHTFAVRKFASRSLHRSALTSLRARYKKNNTSEKHCLFYMRYGKCSRGTTCKYIHDPERIAICTRYLRGTCNIENCPFSHEAKKEKVPVCQHFLRGRCLRDNCPYLHVNVGKDAPICKNFAEYRYCYLGEKCKKLHTDVCPDRDDKGSCPKGKACRLRHPLKASKKKTTARYTDQDLKQQPKEVTTKPRYTDAVITVNSDDDSGDDDDILILPPRGELVTALPSFIKLTDESLAKPDTTRVSKPTADVKPKQTLKKKPNFL